MLVYQRVLYLFRSVARVCIWRSGGQQISFASTGDRCFRALLGAAMAMGGSIKNQWFLGFSRYIVRFFVENPALPILFLCNHFMRSQMIIESMILSAVPAHCGQELANRSASIGRGLLCSKIERGSLFWSPPLNHLSIVQPPCWLFIIWHMGLYYPIYGRWS